MKCRKWFRYFSQCDPAKEGDFALHSSIVDEMHRIKEAAFQARREGRQSVVNALAAYVVRYEGGVTLEECRFLADYQLVEYDKKKGEYVVNREVVEVIRYFLDVQESGRFGSIRGMLRKHYTCDPEMVRRLEGLILKLPDVEVFRPTDFAAMDLIHNCGRERILRPDLTGLFLTHFGRKRAERTSLTMVQAQPRDSALTIYS